MLAILRTLVVGLVFGLILRILLPLFVIGLGIGILAVCTLGE